MHLGFSKSDHCRCEFIHAVTAQVFRYISVARKHAKENRSFIGFDNHKIIIYIIDTSSEEVARNPPRVSSQVSFCVFYLNLLHFSRISEC
jgi:hypothetical protein